MRLAFMGTPDFAVPVLRALADAGHDIAAVYTQPPRPAGRGKQPRPSAVAVAAGALGLPVLTPASFRDPDVLAGFEAMAVDAAVVVAYGQILPRRALDAPRLGCFNIHASLLPRWRGAAPIQRAIMAGDAETGVCVMRMEEGLDTGPVLTCEATPIAPGDTAASLHDRLAGMGAALMVRALDAIAQGRLSARPQPDQGVTYAAKIEKAEARIDWTRDAAALSAHIRGLSPFPGAWCEIAGERIKILMALSEDGTGAPGEVLDDRLLVACGQGALRLETLQRAGRAAMPAAQFLNGLPLARGARLG
ncbi:methionyl-tRNA formyltransferase [Limibaculum sp. M0105]|uniref:Methionyl-tRNA formyltransferase n=1 Tax=Thermohalobaculum xanthum TaxID=2753746 RepID=A0A8J7M730_9RHOB|nr:methionyl-tRNA formyltransferase [Thermohalobaculum xanthum]MBK0399400.1 methionyl-tRNA formyltransferase [Thermohalobaculum xanthum]